MAPSPVDYALRFEGFFKVETEGKYQFSLESDDGSQPVLGRLGNNR